MAVPYTLGDLLGEPELGVELLVGGEAARSRPISGAHSIEVERPTRWLDRDWLMLTTGVRLRRNAAAQRELVRELHEVGAAALAFGIGDVFKQVPVALIEEARRQRFPLAVIPGPTPFRAVIGAVYRATLSGDLRSFQRLTAMQRYLTDALGGEHPLQTVIERLAELLGATVAVIGVDGEIESATGPIPAAPLWCRIARRPSTLLELDVDHWHCVAAPVKSQPDVPERWLVVANRGPQFANNLTKPAVQATTPLLTALGKLDQVSREQDRVARAALLDAILESADPVESRLLGTRSESFGIDFSAPAHVGLVAVPGEGLDALRDRIQSRLERRHAPHLVSRVGDRLCLLVQENGGTVHDLLAEAIGSEPGAVAGYGRGADSVEGIVTSFHDAQLALERLGAEDGPLLEFGDFDLVTLLLSTSHREWVVAKVDAILAPLRDNEPLLETLESYFRHDLDVARAAAALQLHPNSLRYRLNRIEGLIGRSLREPATIATLHLALVESAARGSANGVR